MFESVLKISECVEICNTFLKYIEKELKTVKKHVEIFSMF